MADHRIDIKQNTSSAATTGGLVESGGQTLSMAAVADGEFLKRVGTEIVGAVAGGGGGSLFTDADATGATERITASSTTPLGTYATISGGVDGTASGNYSTVSGGYLNKASGNYSTVSGGSGNTASGYYSWAGGRQADTNFLNGTFVWADSIVDLSTYIPNAANQFAIRAAGGLRLIDGTADQAGWVLTSDGNGVGKWAAPSGGGGSSTLASLTDVNISIVDPDTGSGGSGDGDGGYPDPGDVLTWDDANSEWIAAPAPSGGGSGGTVQGTDTNTYNIRAANEGATAGGARGENSVDLQTSRSIATTNLRGISRANQVVAFGSGKSCCTLSGGNANAITSAVDFASTISGGSDNTISSDYGYETICGGRNNYIIASGMSLEGSFNSIIGGSNNEIIESSGSTIGGENNTIHSSARATAFGSSNRIEDGAVSAFVTGAYARADKYGQRSHASGSFTTTPGTAQTSTYILRNQTSTATPTLLYADGTGVSLASRITIPTPSLFTNWTFRVMLTAVQEIPGAGDASFHINGALRLDNFGPSLTGAFTLDPNAAANRTEYNPYGWTVTLLIGTSISEKTLDIQVTGNTNGMIRWVAAIDTVETYI